MEAPRCGLFGFLNPGLRHAVIWGYLLAILIGFQAGPGNTQRTVKSFKCPQQFGYFQDSSDCNKYYICVFGDAVQEKCTPGLYFNNELRMCDWPRNVKSCSSGEKSGSEYSARQYGTSTSSPRSRSRTSNARTTSSKDDSIPSSNSISVPQQSSRANNRYNPPISRESYMAAARNATFRPPSSLAHVRTTTTTTTTTPRPRPPVITSAPVTFRPQQVRATSRPYSVQAVPREPLRPLPSTYGGKRKDYDDSEYFDDDDYEDDEVENEPKVVLNNHDIRKTTETYVRPIEPTVHQNTRQQSTYTNSRTPSRSSGSSSSAGTDYRTRNQHANSVSNSVPDSSRISSGRTVSVPSQRGRSSSSNRGDNSLSDSSSSIDSDEFSKSYGSYNTQRAPQTNRERYSSGDMDLSRHQGRNQQPVNTYRSQSNRNSNSNSALSNTYSSRPRESDSLIRLQPQQVRGPPKQSLDNGRDSLDAQYGTNPRSFSLPDTPHRLNSFISNNDNRKAERNQQHPNKPQVTSTRYLSPVRPAYEQNSSPQEFDDYPEYYYDDEYYDDDDDEPLPTRGPKVVFRIHKPPSSTTSTTTTLRPPPSTTRRTTTTTTTRRPATTRPAKRGLPFGISRPATKSPLRIGPKALPRLPSRPPPLYSTPRALVPAEKCTAQKCRLPDCRCGSSDIPGGLPANQVPQIVLVTFDDAVNDLNYELYQELFEGRRNPNGCPILGTFYVSHEWTDYGMVQTLYSKGHEMASHSITHSHGEKFTVSQWTKEINGQREILHLYGGVKLEDIRGMRAPFLQVGGNNMFESLYESNFTYDSSMPVLDNNPPFYPYTLDYTVNHECMIPPCPNKAFPGLWEVGMVMWIDYRGGRCSMGDACANPDNSEEVYEMLMKNFNRHYNSNRAPFGLYYHAAWFTTQHYRKGYMKFIEHINAKNDVYIVTNWQAIQWMRDPTPLSRINSFAPWQCPKDTEKPDPCHHPTTCNIGYKGGSRNLKTCQPCPSTFPWTGRTGFDEVYGK